MPANGSIRGIVVAHLFATGRSVNGNRLIAVGATKITSDDIPQYREWICNPGRHMTRRLINKSGFSDADCMHAPPQEAVLSQLADFLRDIHVLFVCDFENQVEWFNSLVLPATHQHLVVVDLVLMSHFFMPHRTHVFSEADVLHSERHPRPRRSMRLQRVVRGMQRLLEELVRQLRGVAVPAHYARCLDSLLAIALQATDPPQDFGALYKVGRMAPSLRWHEDALFLPESYSDTSARFTKAEIDRLFADPFRQLLGDRWPMVDTLSPAQIERIVRESLTANRIPDKQHLIRCADPEETVSILRRHVKNRAFGGEDNPDQQEYAKGVAGALCAPGLHVIEAGTGTGKTLAYLISLCEMVRLNRMDATAVVAVSTKNLIQQAGAKEWQRLPKAYTRTLRPALIFGRGNFMCLTAWARCVRERKWPDTRADEWLALLHFLAVALFNQGRWAGGAAVVDRRFPMIGDLFDEELNAADSCLPGVCRDPNVCFYGRHLIEAGVADMRFTSHAKLASDLHLGKRYPCTTSVVVLHPHVQELPWQQGGLSAVLGEKELLAALQRVGQSIRATDNNKDLTVRARAELAEAEKLAIGIGDEFRRLGRNNVGDTFSVPRETAQRLSNRLFTLCHRLSTVLRTEQGASPPIDSVAPGLEQVTETISTLASRLSTGELAHGVQMPVYGADESGVQWTCAEVRRRATFCVVDEADQFADNARGVIASEITADGMYGLFTRMAGGGKRRGFVQSLEYHLKEMELHDLLDKVTPRLQSVVRKVTDASGLLRTMEAGFPGNSGFASASRILRSPECDRVVELIVKVGQYLKVISDEWDCVYKLFNQLGEDGRRGRMRDSRARVRLYSELAKRYAEQHVPELACNSEDSVLSVAVARRSGHDTRPWVKWTLRRDRLDLSGLMNTLARGIRSTVLTSGTLYVDDSVEFLRRELCLGSDPPSRGIATDTRIESRFDYGKRVLFQFPRFLRKCDYECRQVTRWDLTAAQTIAVQCVVLSGRTLVLFTSFADMFRYYRAIAPVLEKYDIEAIHQRGSSLQEIEQFRATEESVLFGVTRFWAGVDFPGPTLSQVIVVRLPNPPQSHPLIDLRKRQMPHDEFYSKFYHPYGRMRLRQGFGRLMRKSNDRGTFLLLDRRFDNYEGALPVYPHRYDVPNEMARDAAVHGQFLAEFEARNVDLDAVRQGVLLGWKNRPAQPPLLLSRT